MGDTALILCQRCSTKKDMGEMKLDKDRNILLCAKCYYQVFSHGREERVVQRADVHRIQYGCDTCGFKFSRNEGFVFGGMCFHCGRKTVRREDTKELMVRPEKTLMDY